jgi:hypothetical protein
MIVLGVDVKAHVDEVKSISGSWFRASTMIILNKIPTRCTLVLKSLKTLF